MVDIEYRAPETIITGASEIGGKSKKKKKKPARSTTAQRMKQRRAQGGTGSY